MMPEETAIGIIRADMAPENKVKNIVIALTTAKREGLEDGIRLVQDWFRLRPDERPHPDMLIEAFRARIAELESEK